MDSTDSHQHDITVLDGLANDAADEAPPIKEEIAELASLDTQVKLEIAEAQTAAHAEATSFINSALNPVVIKDETPIPEDTPAPDSAFKVPTFAPQDLLLIHDLIGPILTAEQPEKDSDADIQSSDDGQISDSEIQAVPVKVEDSVAPVAAVPSDSDSSDYDSDTDSDVSSDDSTTEAEALKAKGPGRKMKTVVDDFEDDDDAGPKNGKYFQTANELAEPDITVPEIEEVAPEDTLEKVGHVMSIIDKLVIIKGVEVQRRSDTALDSDTLLVFDDRKVLGYIYETFGPTSQPLYQVKFSQNYPLDPEKVRVDREVFHVPRHSRFVFLSQISRMKGSDASNVNDEEPADDELEFSDDEAEAAYKSNLKRKRGESRANSVAASSRQSTPFTSRSRDQDDDSNMYPLHGPYDMDIGAGPSRPAPIPYDDPYADAFTNPEPSDNSEPHAASEEPKPRNTRPNDRESTRGRGRGRGRGRDDTRGSRDGNGRGGGRGRGRGRGGGPREDRQEKPNHPSHHTPPAAPIPRSLSPTSMAIAKATGQYSDGSNYGAPQSIPPQQPTGNLAPYPNWQFQFSPQNGFPHQPMYQNQGYPQHQQQQFVQPHINPRFAQAFAMNMAFQQPQMQRPQAYSPYTSLAQQPSASSTAAALPPGHSSNPSSWTDEWTVHGGDGASRGDPT